MSPNFVPKSRRDLTAADFHGAEDLGSFGLSYDLNLTAQDGKNDPYTFKAEFLSRLQTQATVTSKDGKLTTVYHYKLGGKITCAEFEIEDYLLLKRKNLLAKSLDRALMDARPNFSIEEIPWDYTPDLSSATSASTSAFKINAEQALGKFIHEHAELLENTRTAIKCFFRTIDTQIAALAPQEIEAFKNRFGLEKKLGTYGREHTANILGYLFGNMFQYYNGDIVRVEGNAVLIPSYWVRETEQEFEDKNKKFLGYGMKPAVVDFGFDPYPWAMIRINAIWTSMDKVIRAKVGFGQKDNKLSDQQVYIIVKRGEKMVFKALDKQYFAGGKLADDRMEVLTSLALGQVEAEHQELDLK
jgi:hypothetical protein